MMKSTDNSLDSSPVESDGLKLLKIGTKTEPDGNTALSGKVAGRFNYVFHPFVTFGADGSISRFGCDCREFLSDRKMCPHCALLLESFSSGIGCEENGSDLTPPAEKAREKVGVEKETVKRDPDADVTVDEKAEPERVFSPPGISVTLGDDIETGEKVMWYPNDTEQLFHVNTGIIGTMGTGKTQMTKSIVCQLVRESQNNFGAPGPGIVIFDYKGDYNENRKEFTEATGAKVYKAFKLPFNPFALNIPASFKPILPLHTANTFKDTLSRIYRLGPKQQKLLLDCIRTAYEKCGIRKDFPVTWTRTAPVFEQIRKIYDDVPDDKHNDSLAAAIYKISDFCIFEDDPERTTSVSSLMHGVTVFDLSGYDEDIQSLIVAIMLDLIYSYMMTLSPGASDGRYRQFRAMILVDEADNFMSCGFPSLKKIMKEGREFGFGTVLSTQSLSHFAGEDDDYSRYILTWIVHSAADLSRREVEYIFKFPPKSPEIEKTYGLIKGLGKHQSTVRISNKDPDVIKDLAFFQISNPDNTTPSSERERAK